MTHRENIFRRFGFPLSLSLSLEDLSVLFGVPLEALEEVYKRGTGAWGSNIGSVRLKKDFSKNPNTKKYPRRSRLTKEQWSFARVYSFLDKGKTYHTADSDIARYIGY